MEPADNLRDTPGLGFLAGGKAATRLILARDWSDHPLGQPAAWPDALKTALSLVLNSPESMILCWGHEDLFFFFNETYFPLLGPRLDWAMGAPFRRVWADGLDQAMPIVEAAFAGRSQRFVDLPWKLDTDRGAAETWWSFSYSRILDADGAVDGLFIFTNETTARVLTDRALSDSQAQLRALNESLERQIDERTAERDMMWNTSPDLMVVMSPDGIYRHVNPAWTTVLGYDPSEVIGKHAFDLTHPDDLEATIAALQTAQAGTLPSFENRYRHKDGSYRWLQWVGAPETDRIFAIGRHISDAKAAETMLRETEAQLAQAHKMEAIGQLTGGVAHDFNNLLTIIRGSVEMLRRPGLPDDKRDRYIAAIGETSERAAKLTGQLLAFARRQALTPERIDVADTVRGIAEMIRTLIGGRIALDLDLPEVACTAEVDRGQLENAIVNMAVNARDAMDGEGTLSITVAAVSRLPSARAQPAVDGAFVTVTVADSGAGIAPDDLARIFEPFYTTKEVGRGTGLGLSQAIGFAKQSGGDIMVESEVGRGTSFALYLPQVEERADDIVGVVEDARADAGGGLCVLLVEDNEEVGRFAADALRELGHHSVHASTGRAALDELEKDAMRFDVVFSDVVMPGMNGVELGNAIRAGYPALPVVLTSGYSHVLAANGQHGFDLLHKPYSVEQLSGVLRKAAAG
ncbi:hybrid sensor histidine kinase/response regulator [Sphingomonas sp. RS2018]